MTITYPLSMPSTPGFRTTGWRMYDVVGATESDFSLAQQVHEFTGKRLSVEVELPPMRPAQAGAWAAFFARLKGRRGTFLMPAPAGMSLGAGGGTPVTAGSNAVLAEVLNVRALPEIAGVWLAGRWIQLGTGATARLHMVTADVAGNVGSPQGDAAVDIWPSLRATYADGSAITVSAPKGVFRLADNARDVDVDMAVNYGFSFSAQEAL
jgi:hypothetical protein